MYLFKGSLLLFRRSDLSDLYSKMKAELEVPPFPEKVL